MAEYGVSIEKVGRDKVTITVLIMPNKRKEFDILVTDKGLEITTDRDIRVSLPSSNSVIVDEAS